MKIKTTKKGNVQITMSEAHAEALSYLLGGTSPNSRNAAVNTHQASGVVFKPWTDERDALVSEIGSMLRERDVWLWGV